MSIIDGYELDALRDVYEAADSLVALWESQKIEGLPRVIRNTAIEDYRARLIEAVKACRAQSPSATEPAPAKPA